MDYMVGLINKLGLNKIYILGHKVTDVDSYFSMELLFKLLIRFGVYAKPALQIDYNDIDDFTKKIIEKYSDILIKKQEIGEKDFVFLVDHNNLFESVKDVKKEKVLGIIDHHMDDGSEVDFKIIEPAGSTTVLIYNLYQELGTYMDNEDKLKVLISLLIDTNFLMSDKAKEKDVKLALELSEELGCNIEGLKQEYLLPTNLDAPLNEVALHGLKEFHIKDVVVRTSYIEHFGDDNSLLKVEEIKEYLEKTSDELFVFIVKDFTAGKTEVFSFGKLRDKIPYKRFDYIASRADTIVPMIKNSL